MGAVLRGLTSEPRLLRRTYWAFLDMSGGSSDSATLAIGYLDGTTFRIVRVVDQGQPAPFDPNKCPARWAPILGITRVWGDTYGGMTFREAFREQGITYQVCKLSASDLYEHLEPLLNAGRVAWIDEPRIEQEALGLLWRGSKITHPGGEHDDFINSLAGCVWLLDLQTTVVRAKTIEEEEERRPEGAYDEYLRKQEEGPGSAGLRRLLRWLVEMQTQRAGNAAGAAYEAELEAALLVSPHAEVFRAMRETAYEWLGLRRGLDNGNLTNIEAEERLDIALDKLEEETAQ